MPANFKVTPEALRTAAQEILSQATDFETEADNTLKVADTLDGGWDGDASEEFHTNIEEFHRWLIEVVATLRDYGDAIKTVADNYETADEESAGSFPK